MKITTFSILLLFSTIVLAQTTPEMIKVEGGTFVMGDPQDSGISNELPAHSVILSDYYIAKTETTVLQWKEYCKSTGHKMPEPPIWGWIDTHPMVNVSWNDVDSYCDWLSDISGKTYRLPTESEWEYAAKGGKMSKGYKYSGGHSVDLACWYKENSGSGTKPVGQKAANELGIYDLSGNVWEWCSDWYGDYTKGPQTNPKGPVAGRDKVLRGGSWFNSSNNCMVTARFLDNPTYFNNNRGFRVVYSE